MPIDNISGDSTEPNRSFGSARIKLGWAEENIRKLEVLLNQLLDEYRKSGGASLNAQTGGGQIGNYPLPPVIACMAGDIIFSLRSALDCCWMGLKRAIDETAKKGTLPRADDRNGVKGTIDKTPIEDAFPGVKAMLLDDLRPYRDGNEILWFVGQADNWNKHNMLVLLVQETVFQKAAFSVGQGKMILENVDIRGFGPAGAFSSAHPFILQPESDVTFDVILKLGEAGDERSLMPFLRAALIDTRNGVELFSKLRKVPR